MGKHNNAAKGGPDTKGISPIPSSHVGEAGDTGDVVCDLRDWMASLEDALSQICHFFQNTLPLCAMQQITIWMIFITWASTK